MGLGAELKEAREAQGLSLDALQETTKIQKRYLQAIEQEKFHILPGKFYTRAFIKEYANAVGLDPDILMEQHQNDIPHTEDESTVQYAHMQRSRKDQNTQKSSKVFSIIPMIIVVLLVIGIVFFAWYLVQQSNNDDTDSVDDPKNNDEIIRNSDTDSNDSTEDMDDEDNNTNSDDENGDPDQEANDDENAPDEAEPEFTVVEEGTGNSPESTLDFTYQGDEATLQLDSTGRPWIDIKNEADEVLYSDFLTAEDSPLEMDITDEEKVHLNIGNAKDVKVSINDVELEYPVSVEVVHQKLWLNLINENE